MNTVELTKEQFNAFNELEDKFQMNKDERLKEQPEIFEESLHKRAKAFIKDIRNLMQ